MEFGVRAGQEKLVDTCAHSDGTLKERGRGREEKKTPLYIAICIYIHVHMCLASFMVIRERDARTRRRKFCECNGAES